MDKVRCPACRGAKKVAKLGGMIGECNTCNGQGQINAVDKPIPVIAVANNMPDALVIKAVGDCVPTTTLEIQDLAQESTTRIDPKKAIYKRKKSA